LTHPPTEHDLAAFVDQAGLAPASIVVRRLSAPGEPSREARLDAEAPLYPASMIKLPIAAALTTLWDAHECAPQSNAVVELGDLTANDLPSPFVLGRRATFADLGRLMLTHSDNVATNVLIRVLGRERITALAQAAGLRATAVRRKLSGSLPLIDDPDATGRNAHPAADAALLLERIARGTLPGSAWLQAALSEQRWNGKLSGGLEAGDRFAHKTGDTDEVSHDGGILSLREGPRYIVVVYTALASPDEGDPRFARFMRALRPLLV